MHVRGAGAGPEDLVLEIGTGSGYQAAVLAALEGVVLGKPREEVTDLERTECKARTFLILYGGGAGKLATTLGISKRAAQVLIDEYFQTFDTGYENIPLWVSIEDDRREYYENLGKWDQFVFGLTVPYTFGP